MALIFSLRSMALTLEEYATWLDGRELLWPSLPEVVQAKAKPHLKRLNKVRAVTWSIYGTLLAVPGGTLWFKHPDSFVMTIALDKTVQEFKMWQAMSRKTGTPSEQLLGLYERLLEREELRGTGEFREAPAVRSDQIWTGIVKRLQENEYRFDAGFYGPPSELGEKIAYFFHSNLQATAAYPNSLKALERIKARGCLQLLFDDAQSFTSVQLLRGLRRQGKLSSLSDLFDVETSLLSCQAGIRKPARRLYREILNRLRSKGLYPDQILHVSSRLQTDLLVAKQLGMQTALFAGDKASLSASARQLQDEGTRPDILVLDLSQVADVVEKS
jgi:FMN phosphatase YigB (HAD superfamily)